MTHVESLRVSDDVVIDVIVVRSTHDVPYYLTKRFQNVREGNIYVRVNDTNTPIDRTADRLSVEALWKRHFGLDLSPYERFCELLKDKDGWVESPEHAHSLKEYHKQHPEFTIERCADEDLDSPEFYCFAQYDHRPSWYEIVIRHQQTVLATEQGIWLDGGRYFAPVPERGYIHFDNPIDFSYTYCYFIEGSIGRRLQDHFYTDDGDDERIARRKFDEVVLYFQDEEERKHFFALIEVFESRFRRLLESMDDPYVEEGIPGRDMYVRDLKAAYALKRLLASYRAALVESGGCDPGQLFTESEAAVAECKPAVNNGVE